MIEKLSIRNFKSVKELEIDCRRVHRMGREREDRIIDGETKLTVAAIFLIDDNWLT